MADLDYGNKDIPRNYDDYMLASSEARARLMAESTRSKKKISSCKNLSEGLQRTSQKQSKRLRGES